MDIDAVPEPGESFSWCYNEKVGALTVVAVNLTGPAPDDYMATVDVTNDKGAPTRHVWTRLEFRSFLRRVLPYKLTRFALLGDE